MKSENITSEIGNSKNSIYNLGFYSAILTSLLTVVTFVIAFLTPPLSGPFCVAQSCLAYPYLDSVARFPRDFYWMYPAIALFFAYAILMATVHHSAPDNKKIYSHIGLFFAMFGAMILITNYFLQLSVIQPSLLNNESDGISLFSQYNPHGIFIALEELGYFFIAVAFLLFAPVFGGSKLTNAIRWIFISCFLLTVVAFAYFSFAYGINREYRFEVTAISLSFLTLIASGILLSIFFKKHKF